MILNATLPQKHEEVTAALSIFFFLAMCTEFNLPWGGEGKSQYCLVSYCIVSIYDANTQFNTKSSLAGIVHL